MYKIHIKVLVLLLIGGLYTNARSQSVGINTTGSPADASSMLDVSAGDKGILIPRVSLVNVTNATTPVNTPASGLLVYNTNAAVVGGFGEGFYYWSGTAWTKMATGNALSASLTNGRIWIGNGSNVPAEQQMTGDATLSNTGTLDLNDLAVETSEINDLAVTTGKIANNAVDGAKINIASNANGDLMYYNGTDWVRLAAGTSGNILRTNGSGAPTWVTVNSLIGSGTQNQVAKWNNAAGTTLGNSQIVDNGTNVGIGMSPSHKLDVQTGNIRASGQNTMIGAHPTYPSYSAWWREGSDYTLLTEGSNTFLNAPLANGNIYMRTANADKLFVRGSDGFVGIGNTNPGHKLQVTGDIWADGRYVVQNATDGGTSRGIRMWTAGDSNWGIYMGQSGAGRSFSGGTATAGGGFTAHAIRFRVNNDNNQGFIFENSAEHNLLSIRGGNGRITIRGGVLFDCPGCGATNTVDGSSDWGDLTIQGRVISTNSNLHLSPPGGNAVYINSDYRAAGGVTGRTDLYVAGHVFPQTNVSFNLGALGLAWFDTYTDAVFRNYEFALSDERMKTNILKLENVMPSVMSLNAVRYDYNLDKMYNGTWKQREYINIDGKNNLGFIAQEVKEIFPELVKFHEEKDVYMVNYEGLIPVLVKAIQEQQLQIEQLGKEIEELKAN